jgi:hypothetical protein
MVEDAFELLVKIEGGGGENWPPLPGDNGGDRELIIGGAERGF